MGKCFRNISSHPACRHFWISKINWMHLICYWNVFSLRFKMSNFLYSRLQNPNVVQVVDGHSSPLECGFELKYQVQPQYVKVHLQHSHEDKNIPNLFTCSVDLTQGLLLSCYWQQTFPPHPLILKMLTIQTYKLF